MPEEERVDVLIVGASFAGLAVASRLRGDVVVIDAYPVGAFRRSACGTFLSVPRGLGLEDTVVQVSERALIHAPGVPRFALEDPLCTVDYERFCRGLLARSSARFLQTTFRALEGSPLAPVVVTEDGRFRARCVVDASGWRAVVASAARPGFVNRRNLSFGLETESAYHADAFYFWLDQSVMRDGVGWLFPAGEASRLGLASYRGEGVKSSNVAELLRVTGTEPSTYHGGFFPYGLREPAVGNIFVVGDAAGQCLPLTGEGIRPALYFGQRLGGLLQRVIDRELNPAEAQAAYRRIVERFRWHYWLLRAAQRGVPALPQPLLRPLLRLLEIPAVGRWCLRHYLDMMRLPAVPASDAAAQVTGHDTFRLGTREPVVEPLRTERSARR